MKPQEAKARLLAELAKSNRNKRDWYREVYLYSAHWSELRGRALKLYGSHCAKCGSNRKLEVHHLRYKSIFDVALHDLEVLCRNCHKKELPTNTSPRNKKPKRSMSDYDGLLAKMEAEFSQSPSPAARAIEYVLSRFGKHMPSAHRKALSARKKKLPSPP
jgi:hypothetical protein